MRGVVWVVSGGLDGMLLRRFGMVVWEFEMGIMACSSRWTMMVQIQE